jgi:Uma2 family endonuclease
MNSISGLNEPLHQVIISNILFHTRLHLYELDQQYEYYVAPEMVVKNATIMDKLIIPDIVIMKSVSTWNKPIIIIEVTKKRGFKKDIAKVTDAIKHIPSIQEAFVIDYQSIDAYKIFRQNDGTLEFYYNDILSNVLEFDFKDCLR